MGGKRNGLLIRKRIIRIDDWKQRESSAVHHCGIIKGKSSLSHKNINDNYVKILTVLFRGC